MKIRDDFTCAVQGINKNTGNTEKINYVFDRTFGMDSTQQEVYTQSVQPIVESVLDGYNGTILAYGQTSSGKTYTMTGRNGVDGNDLEKGIIPRMVQDIFKKIKEAPDDIEFSIKVSMIEIYNERIRDLLDTKKTNLQIHETKETGIYVQDMTEYSATEENEVYNVMRAGNNNRSTGSTEMNKDSSRSHSCFIIQIKQKNITDFSVKSGKIFLVDLAGSERIAKTGA